MVNAVIKVMFNVEDMEGNPVDLKDLAKELSKASSPGVWGPSIYVNCTGGSKAHISIMESLNNDGLRYHVTMDEIPRDGDLILLTNAITRVTNELTLQFLLERKCVDFEKEIKSLSEEKNVSFSR